jgi:hypothetical protein
MSELDPEARRILYLARTARTPSAEDQARVARRFALAAGISAGATLVASSAKAAKTASILGPLKLWLTGGALLGAAVGGYLTLHAPQPRAAASKAQATVAPAPARQPEPPARAASPAPAAPAAATPAIARRQQLQATLPAELELLHEAQAAWRSRSPGRALELLASHRQRYPRSQLRSERDTLEVLAGCELGHTLRATRLARKLLAREPHCPARAAIEQSCGIE